MASPLQDNPDLPDVQTGPSALIGIGVTGAVLAVDDRTVIKRVPWSDSTYDNNQSLEDIWMERRIYVRLGEHPRICKYLGPVRRGILLERLGDSLRKHLVQLRKNGTSPSFRQALLWSVQAAEAISYLHSKAVIQGDIGCYNFLLDNHNDVKVCDFGGSSIDGCDVKVGYGIRSQLCRENWRFDDSPSIANELFALGSTFYEIWTTKQPYEDLSDREVETRYENQQFPDLEGLPVAEVISKCWLGRYTSATEVTKDLEKLQERRANDSIKLPMPARSSTAVFTASAAVATVILLSRLKRIWIPFTRNPR